MMQDQSVTSIVYMDADDAGDVKSAEKVSYICCGHTQTQIWRHIAVDNVLFM